MITAPRGIVAMPDISMPGSPGIIRLPPIIGPSDIAQAPNFDPEIISGGNKPWQSLSPYDYSQYCKRWMKDDGLTCGREGIKDPSDYIPYVSPTRTSNIPVGFKCIEPTYFPELSGPSGPSAAGVEDWESLLRDARRNIRK